VPSLHALAEATSLRVVVTQPDRRAGRGQHLRATPVKIAAQELGIPTIEPETLRVPIPELMGEAFDLFAVASYGKIVPQALLDLPRFGALNVHPSPLPLYRGATPLQSQIRDGVTGSGVTIIMMDAGMDTGDIVAQERSEIGETETYGELHDRFAQLGASLLHRAVERLKEGKLARVPQQGLVPADRIAATLTRPLGKADLEVNPSWPARRLYNHLRALIPEPLGRIPVPEGMAKVLEVRLADAAELARLGTGLRTSSWFSTPDLPGVLACVRPDGAVLITRLIPPNRKAMSAAEYVRALGRPFVSRVHT
jgi:methionyl-tRNA formyltransferase